MPPPSAVTGNTDNSLQEKMAQIADSPEYTGCVCVCVCMCVFSSCCNSEEMLALKQKSMLRTCNLFVGLFSSLSSFCFSLDVLYQTPPHRRLALNRSGWLHLPRKEESTEIRWAQTVWVVNPFPSDQQHFSFSTFLFTEILWRRFVPENRQELQNQHFLTK